MVTGLKLRSAFSILAVVSALSLATPATAHAGERGQARRAFRELKRSSPQARQAYRDALKKHSFRTSIFAATLFGVLGAGWHFIGTVPGGAPGHAFGLVHDGLAGVAIKEAIEKKQWSRGDVVNAALAGKLGAKAQQIATDKLKLFQSSKILGKDWKAQPGQLVLPL